MSWIKIWGVVETTLKNPQSYINEQSLISDGKRMCRWKIIIFLKYTRFP